MAETLEERIRGVVQEDVAIEPYNPEWAKLFFKEKKKVQIYANSLFSGCLFL